MIYNKPESVTVVTTPLSCFPHQHQHWKEGEVVHCVVGERDARVIDLDCLRLTGLKLHQMGVQDLKIPLGGKIKVETHGDIQTCTVPGARQEASLVGRFDLFCFCPRVRTRARNRKWCSCSCPHINVGRLEQENVVLWRIKGEVIARLEPPYPAL